MEWAARAIGVFYVLAGVVALGQMAVSWRLEQQCRALLPSRPVLILSADLVLTLGSAMVLMSGVALVLLSPWAVGAFLAGWTIQAGYLLWAQRHSPPDGPVAARLRRRTLDAFAVYSLITALVMAFEQAKVLG